MAPSLRSSAPNTPAGKSSTDSTSTPKSTPRKTPHCTKCKRPRAGHPRQGCPYVDSPLATANGEEQPQILADALEGLHIERPAIAAGPVASPSRRRSSAKVVPEASLMSLSTDSNEVVNALLQPGIMDDDGLNEDERRRSVSRWQEAIATPTKPRPSTKENKSSVRSRMPGTLKTPSPSFFASQDSAIEVDAEHKSASIARDASAISTSTARHAPSSVRPLVRSMSVEERNAFLEGLSEASKAPPATVYALAIDDIPTIQQSATTLGFHSAVMEGAQKGTRSLILGRDEQAVKDLHTRLKDQVNSQGRGTLRTAAEGAVLGAVVTWTGLAFS